MGKKQKKTQECLNNIRIHFPTFENECYVKRTQILRTMIPTIQSVYATIHIYHFQIHFFIHVSICITVITNALRWVELELMYKMDITHIQESVQKNVSIIYVDCGIHRLYCWNGLVDMYSKYVGGLIWRMW